MMYLQYFQTQQIAPSVYKQITIITTIRQSASMIYMARKSLNQTTSNKISIDIQFLDKGVYIVKLTNGLETYNKRIIKI